MTTISVPSPMADRLLQRFHAEELAALAEEREAAITSLRALDARWDVELPPHDSAIQSAEAALKAAEQALEAAQRQLQDVRSDRIRAAHAIDHPRDCLRARLEGELRHPSITAALEQLARCAEATRSLPAELDAGLFVAPEQASATAARQQRITKRLAWLLHTARPALLALQYEPADGIDQKIAKIMADLPALK